MTSPHLACGSNGCTEPVAAQWRRRLTPAELAFHAEQHERLLAWAAYEAGADIPAPQAADEPTRAVYACASHAVHLDLAAHVHAANCQAPHPDHLPGCDCEPEPHPEPEATPTVTLPTGWTVPTP